MANRSLETEVQSQYRPLNKKAKIMEYEGSLYPIESVGESIEEVAKMKRNAPPAHYKVKIESFSQLYGFLSKSGLEKYESHEFEVSGYKWKISLYLNGDSRRNGRDHVSLYLVLSETNHLPLGSEVNAFFKIFFYDQFNDLWLLQEESKNLMRFRAIKTEHGFARFLPLATFKDASNGYLVNDCCIFGAEIIVSNCTRTRELVTISRPEKTITHTIENFSKVEKKQYTSSPVDIAGYKWYSVAYPSGLSFLNNRYLSVYLGLDFGQISPKYQKIWVNFEFRVKSQALVQDVVRADSCWFEASRNVKGFPKFLELSE